MLKKIINLIFPCRFNEIKCKNNFFGCICGKSKSEPAPVPLYEIPTTTLDLRDEIEKYIREGIGKEIPIPEEYGITSQTLQELLGYKPEQFQLPIEEIQKALEAQQAIQYEQYKKEINPQLAAQGQLDSTYRTNLFGDYLRGQQAQTYGTTADLLTQQAQQNAQIQQWLPQFRATVSGQLAGLGGQYADINRFNIENPYNTYIPALQQEYALAVDEYNQKYQQQLGQWQLDYLESLKPSATKQLMMTFDPGGTWLGTYDTQQLGSQPSQNSNLGKIMEAYSAYKSMGGSLANKNTNSFSTGNTQYNPNWSSQSNTLGFNTQKYSY